MKKSILMLLIILIVGVGVYNIRTKENEALPVVKLESDTTKGYEDIIIKRGNEDEKIIALTFDDGPDKDYTPQVLDILKINDVKATFFVVGENVVWNQKILKRQYDEGHEIGNHTFTHINVANSGYSKIDKEISDTQKEIAKVIGKEPSLFRPPYRAISRNMCDIIKNNNMNIVLWSNLDPRDWSNPGVGYIVDTVVNKVQNGSIILMHDYNRIRTPKSQTVKALEIIIPALKEKGYKFVTISELMERQKNYPSESDKINEVN